MMNVYIFARRVAIAAFIVLLIGAGFYLLVQSAYFFLLVFSGILLAVLLSGLTDVFVEKLHFKRWISLLLATLLFFGVIVGAFWLIAPTVADQFSEMRKALPDAMNKVESWLGQYSWGDKVIEKVPDDVSDVMSGNSSDIFSNVTGAFSSTLSFIADFAIVIITALFFASNPKVYTLGLARLFPVRNRTRILEVMQKLYKTLEMWLIGMVSAMAIIGVSTAIAYNIIGLRMAFALALISFFLAFIPNVGPWIAGLPAVLVGLIQGPDVALTVIVVYGAIQLVETYVITPIIFQKTVDLPPALLLFVQVLFGILMGPLGLLMAAPILAVMMVLVNEFYIKDVLEAEPQEKNLR